MEEQQRRQVTFQPPPGPRMRPEWEDLVVLHGVTSLSINYPLEPLEYPRFAPPLLESTPYESGEFVIKDKNNERLWNYFWLSKSVPEQCQAFGARPGLFRWLKANASKLYLGIIRKPYDPLNPITKNIECFVPNQFPKDPQFTYVTALSWAQTLSHDEFQNLNLVNRRAPGLVTTGLESKKFHGLYGGEIKTQKKENPSEQIKKGQERRKKLTYPEYFPSGTSTSLREAIRDNPDRLISEEERLNNLKGSYEQYLGGRRVNDKLEEPTLNHLINIGLDTHASPLEARALFHQQKAHQMGQQSELFES
ncbi:uncharacterized protein LOC142339799 [Convolutriloba macropyga]|uniref:uncharacterized protein LOC142339799 n=1 Tax=Convolutriloba macropyga TaxID=536237 RepID=UPI003F51FC36